MAPRPAPDLTQRRDQVLDAARRVAEAEGWSGVTMRRLAGDLGVTQPVLYSAFANRQAIVDAIALQGFDEMAAELEVTEATPLPRMRAYLGFAADRPWVYEAMFSLQVDLSFATEGTPAPLLRAFAAVREAFPDEDGTRAEVAWSTLHGLAALQASGRLRPDHAEARLALAQQLLGAPAGG